MSTSGANAAPAPSKNILDRPLSKGPGRFVSESSFSFLFSELIQYSQNRVNDIADLENKLKDAGHRVGWRILNLVVHRERPHRRDTKVVTILQFISSKCWKTLFGKATDALERSTESESIYYMYENEPLTNKFISLPRELEGRLNCANFNAGIIRGILDAANFPADVKAVSVTNNGVTKTVYVVEFDKSFLRDTAS
uniref:Trafficking protein particle complex subunit n=1 Tax=Aplanochytrium stocchinoi TaxID=215587 RepID=A0A7S3LJ57_9STRA|mmetsp:Transcript_2759/g.3498  ORF Transcript_2759/g.3498 Transcript_2759/m.3498 type:complete len:196 (+) Transcript_2759:211-798(+)|eukprot:CAMPEP_0204829074 /NCGR_PEP_ID=MMETSP1346-20131115/7082_1 /ASSEMBLY_ACC=CAM_ASM_000771 /TAXON_ID=215587 /ORGANISM="Aplanochytrium stocchinoi, Strain GSBS06" /LENGTH=195 /DNA_ID=CAMNT_0051958579 /DNA_START=490 /DNA_END=1077 /DNA_ORIENTATION=-